MSGVVDNGAREREREIVRSAEYAVDRAAWNVHCIESAAETAEKEGADQRVRAVKARAKLAVNQAALEALRAQFPDVEPKEVYLHGVA